MTRWEMRALTRPQLVCLNYNRKVENERLCRCVGRNQTQSNPLSPTQVHSL